VQCVHEVFDIGAGGGYFALRFAEGVEKGGRVYAVDTNSKLLKYVRYCAVEKGFENIETIPAT